MQPETALLWWWLNALNKKRYDALLQRFGSLDGALAALSPTLLSELGLREETVQSTFLRLEDFDPAAYLQSMRKLGVELLSIEDDAYPSLLHEIGDPPIFLSYRGDLSLIDQPCIALVGTRQMTQYGRRVAGRVTEDVANAGVVTVSGLAHGIDTEVARETLHAGGKHIAVLGHGLKRIFPMENAELGEEILRSGGLLLSEFPLEMEANLYTFPARNRIIAGVSIATIVLEAPEKSGAIITAELALDYNRDVFAVPGNIFDLTFAGCNALIARGHARLLTSAADALTELGVIAPEKERLSTYIPKSPEEETALRALTTMPQSMDQLVEKTSLATGILSATLTMLELAGAARNVGSGQWVKA